VRIAFRLKPPDLIEDLLHSIAAES
jgi:hypothetical protein